MHTIKEYNFFGMDSMDYPDGIPSRLYVVNTLYPIGRPVRATITLYPIGRPVRATITLYPIGRPVRATITLYPRETC